MLRTAAAIFAAVIVTPTTTAVNLEMVHDFGPNETFDDGLTSG